MLPEYHDVEMLPECFQSAEEMLSGCCRNDAGMLPESHGKARNINRSLNLTAHPLRLARIRVCLLSGIGSFSGHLLQDELHG